MTFCRFMLIISLTSILALASCLQLVGCEADSEIGNRRAVQTKIADVDSFVALSNDNDFGVSANIPGVEGAFAVVATDDIGGVYVTYQSQWTENSTESETFHIYFAYSHDYGESWSQSFRINDNGSSSVQCDSPSIAVDQTNGHIFVAWKDNRTGVANVYIDRSMNRGVSFGSDVTVHDWPNDYIPPWLPYTVNLEISDTGILYVAWKAYSGNSYSNCNIFFSHSIDNGQTFSAPVIVDSTTGEAIVAHPWVVIDSRNVLYVGYTKRNSTSANVYLTKSENSGSSFDTPVKVTDVSTQNYCGGVQVAVSSDGKIHAVWTDNRAGDGTEYLDIYYATSLDNGLSFGSNLRVNDDVVVSPPDTHPHFTRGAQGTPTIVTDSDSKVHIFWEDFRNFLSDTTYCRDIYYASSSNGMQFSSNLKVNYVHPDVDSVNCADPNIAIDSRDTIFLVYSDAPSGDNDHHSIYFMPIPSVTEQPSEQSSEQPSETSSSALGFHLIAIFTALVIAMFLCRKNRI
ncbi:MAG: sialidase family protein [Candidatus Hodarchaeota archaeon]